MADNANNTMFNDTNEGDKSSVMDSDVSSVSTETSVQKTSSEIVSILVGEGKKYKSVDDLAKAYLSADDFIEKLKAENAELRTKSTSSKTIEDVLEQLNRQQSQPVDQQGSLSISDLSKIVEQTVTGLETKKQRESNLLTADKRMKEVFGEQANQKFAEVAKTPELKKIYTELAAVDPEKFVSLFVSPDVPKNVVDTGGSVNTTVRYSDTNNSSRAAQVGTKEYFDNIRRTKPALYYSQDFQLNMDRTVRSNPDLYYGKR